MPRDYTSNSFVMKALYESLEQSDKVRPSLLTDEIINREHPFLRGLESLKESGRHLSDLGKKDRARWEFGIISKKMERDGQDQLTIGQYERFVDRYEDIFPNIRENMSGAIDELKYRSNQPWLATTAGPGAIAVGFAPFSALFEVLNSANEGQANIISPLLQMMNFTTRFVDELARAEQSEEENEQTLPGRLSRWIENHTPINLPDFVVENIDDYRLRYFVEDIWNEIAPPVAQLALFKKLGDVGVKAPKAFANEFAAKNATFATAAKKGAQKALGIKTFREKEYSPEEVAVLDIMERAERAGDKETFESTARSHPDMLIEYAKEKGARHMGVRKIKEIYDNVKKGGEVSQRDKVYLVEWAKDTFRGENSSHGSVNTLIRDIKNNPAKSTPELNKQFDSLMAEFTGMFMSHPRFWEGVKQEFQKGVEIGREFGGEIRESLGSQRASVPVGSLVPEFRRRVKKKGKDKLVPVEGKKVDIHPDLETFIHKEGKEWKISEARSGQEIASAKTQKGAIEQAKGLVEKFGVEKLQKRFGEKIKEMGGEEAIIRPRKDIPIEELEVRKEELKSEFEAQSSKVKEMRKKKITGPSLKSEVEKLNRIKEELDIAIESTLTTGEKAKIKRSTKELHKKARVTVDEKIQRKALREKVKADPTDVKAAKELSEFNKKLSKKQSVSRQEVESLAELAPEGIKGEVMKQAKGIPLDKDKLEDTKAFFKSQGYRISDRGTFRSLGEKVDKALDKFDKTGEYSDAEWADLEIQAGHIAQMRQWDIAKTDKLNATVAIEEAKALKATEKITEKQIKKIRELVDKLEDKNPEFLWWDKGWSPINMLIEKVIGNKSLKERAKSLDDAGELMMSRLQEKTAKRWAKLHDAMKLSRDKKLITQAEQLLIDKKVFNAIEGKVDLRTDEFFNRHPKEVREEAIKLQEEITKFLDEARLEIIEFSTDMIEFSKEKIKSVTKTINEYAEAISWVDDGSRIQIELSKILNEAYKISDDLFKKKVEMMRVKKVMEEGGKKNYMPHILDSDYLDAVAKARPEMIEATRTSALTMDNKHLIQREDFPFYDESAISAIYEYEKSLNRSFFNDKLTFELRLDALEQGYHSGTIKGDYLRNYITINLKGERPGRETIGPTAEKIIEATYGAAGFMRNVTGKELKFLNALLERKKVISKKEMEWIKENGRDESVFSFKELPNGEIEMTTRRLQGGPFALDRQITAFKKLGYSGTIGLSPQTTMLNLITQSLISLAYSGLPFFGGMKVWVDANKFALRAWNTGEKGKAFRQKLRDSGLFVTADSIVAPEGKKVGKLEGRISRILDKMLINMPISEYIARTSSARIGAIAYRKGKLTKEDVGEIITIDGVELSVKWANRHNFQYGSSHVPFFAHYPLGKAFMFLGTFTLKQAELHRDIFNKAEFKDFFSESEKIMREDIPWTEKGERIWKEYAKNRNRLGIPKETAYALIAAMLLGQVFDIDFDEFMFTEGITISNPITNLFLGAGGWNQRPFDELKPFIPGRGAVRSLDKTLRLDILSDGRRYGNVPQLLFPDR